ncbi:MAG TPA: MFS transporter [Chloroflexota bacterium]|nr:MFS transporter [Chloroflexota bacterium]
MPVPQATIPVSRAPGLSSRSLAIASFRALWSANFTWNVARWMEQLAIGWISYDLTHSPFLVALLGFYRSLPLFLLGMFGGVMGDRFDRQRIVLTLGVVNVTCMGFVAAMSYAGALDYPTLVIAEVIMGTSMAIDWPSRRALTLDLVGRELLANANALDSAGMNVSRIVGPLVSGAIIAFLGPTSSLGLMALIYVASALVVLKIPRVPASRLRPAASGVFRSLAHGFGYILQDQAVVGVLAITVAMNFLMFPYLQLMPVFAVDILHSGSIGLGVLSAVDGLGSLLGTLYLASIAIQRRDGLIFWVGSALGSLAIIGFALSRDFILACFLLFVGGIGRAGFSALQSTIILRNTSDEMRSRALGFLTLAIGVGPFGSLEVGALSTLSSTPLAVAANAAVCVFLVAGVTARLRGLREA